MPQNFSTHHSNFYMLYLPNAAFDHCYTFLHSALLLSMTNYFGPEAKTSQLLLWHIFVNFMEKGSCIKTLLKTLLKGDSYAGVFL